METATILLGFVFVALVALAVVVWRTRQGSGTDKDKTAELLLQQLGELRRDVDAKLGDSTKAMQDSVHRQLSESTKIVREVTEGLTKLDETNRQVISFADQLKHMQDILQNPKQRGVLGEFFLETVLQDVLPEGTYKTQYQFKNGEAVDAAVFVKEHIVPIDAKFSLENYNRMVEHRDQAERDRLEKLFVNDLKLRIKETSKYIRPEENTTDFAFMFIPSEGIYYDLLSNKVGLIKGEEDNLIQRAYKEYKVIIVSPTTFVAYLQTVLQGLKSLQIEKQAKDIQRRVGDLGRHLGAYNDFMLKLGNALGTTVNHYNKAHKELGKIDKDVVRITGDSPELETLTLEKPQQE